VENNRIVIDTNVIIAAAITKNQNSPPYLILNEVITTSEIDICVSDEVLQEYQDKPQKAKFLKPKFLEKYPDFQKDIKRYQTTINELASYFQPQIEVDKIKDDADNRFLELALEADAFCIITGNTKDFDFEEFEGVKIFTPRDFYEWWEENQ